MFSCVTSGIYVLKDRLKLLSVICLPVQVVACLLELVAFVRSFLTPERQVNCPWAGIARASQMSS